MAHSVNTTCKSALSPSPHVFPTNMGVRGTLSHCVTAEPQCRSYYQVQSSGEKPSSPAEPKGGFTGQIVRGNAFSCTQLATVENPKWRAGPGSPCESTPLRTAPSWPQGSPRGKKGLENSHSFLCSHSVTNPENKLSATKLTCIWSETCQYRSARLRKPELNISRDSQSEVL